MDSLIRIFGILGVAVMAATLAMILLRWEIAARWWFRPAAILFGGACAAGVVFSMREKWDIGAYAYVFLIALLGMWHVILGLLALARYERRPPGQTPLPDVLRTALALDRARQYIGAIAAYDEYLETNPADAAARGRLAEALVHSGNAKRAIAVLTVAFAQAQDDRQRIRFGVRLAELILVARRDPLGARAQLEQVRKLYAGTEHERYAEDLSARMMRRVGQGRYLRSDPPAR